MTPESPSPDIPVNKRGQNLLCRCRLQSDSIRNSPWPNLTSNSQITNNSHMFCPFSFYARLSRHSAAQLCVEACVKVAEQILTVYSFSRSRTDCTTVLSLFRAPLCLLPPSGVWDVNYTLTRCRIGSQMQHNTLMPECDRMITFSALFLIHWAQLTQSRSTSDKHHCSKQADMCHTAEECTLYCMWECLGFIRISVVLYHKVTPSILLPSWSSAAQWAC